MRFGASRACAECLSTHHSHQLYVPWGGRLEIGAHGPPNQACARSSYPQPDSGIPDLENARELWHTLLNLAAPFHDHPDIPEELHEMLARWEAAGGPGRG